MNDPDAEIVRKVIQSLRAQFPAIKPLLADDCNQMSLESYVQTLLGRAENECFAEALDEIHAQHSAKLGTARLRVVDAYREQTGMLFQIFGVLAGKCAPSLITFLPPNIDHEEFEEATVAAIRTIAKLNPDTGASPAAAAAPK